MIRAATGDNIEDIVRMGGHSYRYGAFAEHGLRYDVDSFRDFIRNIYKIQTEKKALILVLVDNATASVVGSIGGILIPWMCDQSQIIMAELWWWVEPGFRGTAGIKLIKTMEKKAREMGAHFMSAITMGYRKEDSLQKLYERMNYKHLEHYHLKRLQP